MKKIVEQLHQTLLLLILSIVMHLASAQGKYPVRTWSSNEYKGGNAVMAVIQDSTGIAYLACHKGLVIFDGARFQLIKMPKNSMPLWFANGENGRVYVSAEDELGYITKEASGHTYHSLTHLIPDYAQGFGSVWEVAQTNYGTYFRTTHYLFRYYQNNIEVLPRENYEGTSFDVIFTIDSTLYLRKYNLGIGKMIGKTFELLPNGDFFKNIKVNAILPFDNRTMVVTRQNGIFVMDEAGVTEFENEIQEQLKIDKAYHATIFKNKIAIATLTNGTYLLNNEGKLLEHFDKKYKLSEAATYVYFDNMGGLWTTTYNGLWRADLNDHIKVYDGISNEKTLILDMKR
ncbi:MAG: hypothetical protein OEY51_13575, partial [Cyclobacteriaceae bacterium]|nr:hypothetical protein [Cyclobacteriaceae bacterium]